MRPDSLSDDPALLAAPPISADAVRAGMAAQPAAARALLDLLAMIDLDDAMHGLEQESLEYGRLQGSDAHGRWLAQRIPAAVYREPGRVRIERIGNVIDIVLDRPWALNAIDRPMRDALHEGFTVAALDPEVMAVRLRGAGRAFCIGGDLDEFGTTRDPAVAHAIRMETLPAHAIVRCGGKFTAHVQGGCVGAGLEMAAFAHRFTATADAWFQLPELAMGLIPGAGGCVSVPRRIGRARTAAMILSGKRIGARTALAWGLIDAIMDDVPVDHGQADIGG
ncbi:enoyl-CoA hydratase/isomerase family protein [Sphingomonas sp. SUN039]|uniref:enoyl-CoA hydratase/isomerase family protein n=1 Tax=Sphingomonas sp. SUN039 TaxID=2937787 RepID=UPI002164439C|nr:enoyl-CoA hydratase/isomerase family protein [Sphingomonas sp. SUN039]UVO55795.1 enoyl-CoA hydratase/isomerase family protein [Sphingomonas sp. SUN039]